MSVLYDDQTNWHGANHVMASDVSDQELLYRSALMRIFVGTVEVGSYETRFIEPYRSHLLALGYIEELSPTLCAMTSKGMVHYAEELQRCDVLQYVKHEMKAALLAALEAHERYDLISQAKWMKKTWNKKQF
jgi:hypothetical protein